MPLFGQLDTAAHVGRASTVTALMTEGDAFSIDDVDVLAFTYEIDIQRGFGTTPKALHPSIPSYCQIVVRRHRDGPFGPFKVAELRVNARAGTHYLAYCVGAFTDNDAAVKFFRDRYGAPMQRADVELDVRYYGVVGSVVVGSKVAFDAVLEKPHYISGSDVLYTPNLNLARVGNETKLVHQEMEYTISRAQRGIAALKAFDAATFGDPNVIVKQPLPATIVQAKVTYTGVRFLIDPERPAMIGTETVAA
jgi:hypothetical protein